MVRGLFIMMTLTSTHVRVNQGERRLVVLFPYNSSESSSIGSL